jgi:MoxR-like ATPase
LIEGRHNLSIDDIQGIALPALRHRLVLTIDAERQSVSPDEIVKEAIEALPRETP